MECLSPRTVCLLLQDPAAVAIFVRLNRSCIWMIKESRRELIDSYSLLLMIDLTGTYITTYNITFCRKKGQTWVARQV